MKIRTSLAGLIAILTLAGALFGPMVKQASATPITVIVGDNGAFTVELCNESDDQLHLSVQTQPTASTDGYATGDIYICIHDDRSFRPSFEVDLHSSNLTSGPNTITADHFKLTYSDRVLQRQWAAKNPPSTTGIGDIGYFIDDAYVAQGSGGPWTTNNSLETARTIMFGYSGRGTILSVGHVNFGLEIPAGTIPGSYASDLTVSVTTSLLP